MASLRKEIRHRFVEILSAAGTSAGMRVFPSRVRPAFGADKYPMICVYSTDETLTVRGSNPTTYQRDLEIMVEAITEGINTDVEDTLDDLGNEIESAIDLDETLVAYVSDVEFKGMNVEFFNTGNKDSASGQLRYQVRYYTIEEEPSEDDLAIVVVNGETINF